MKYEELNKRSRQIKKREYHIIGIAALSLLLAACGAPSASVNGNPDGWENSDAGDGSDIEMPPRGGGIGEEPKEWPREHASCNVQELSGYLYDHVSASPYAGAEIVIKDYEGEQLDTEWDEPSAYRFAGEADVIWQCYNSPAEMDTALNEAAKQKRISFSVLYLPHDRERSRSRSVPHSARQI